MPEGLKYSITNTFAITRDGEQKPMFLDTNTYNGLDYGDVLLIEKVMHETQNKLIEEGAKKQQVK